MTLTLLLDLDDTLLQNGMQTFLPAYIKMLHQQIGSGFPFEDFARILMAATRAASANINPDLTLEEVFDANFYPALGIPKGDLASIIDSFYENMFPGLQSVTTRLPEAQTLMDNACQRGFRLAVATNPLFPRKAMHARVKWAGLNPWDFDLITSMEFMHFSKPHSEYYAELLGLLGWPEGPAIMVGNDLERDILPAQNLGLAVFWINGDPQRARELGVPSGTLAELLPWIDSYSLDKFTPNFDTPGGIQATLRSSAALLDGLLSSLGIANWKQRPASEEWAPVEIVTHLRDVDREVNLPRLEKILKSDNPFIAAINTDAWAAERNYLAADGPAALSDFISGRLAIIQVLESIPPHAWARPARHSIFGPTSLQETANFITTHDRLHIRQIRQTLLLSNPAYL